jgi:hypothetical protein
MSKAINGSNSFSVFAGSSVLENRQGELMISIDHLNLLLFAVILGLSVAGTGILADETLGFGARCAMAALGCCVILVGVTAL